MAEIKIEKKKPVWPWILLLLVIVGVIVYFLVFRDEETNTTVIEETPVAAETDANGNEGNDALSGNAEIAAYVDYIDSNRNEMGLDHEYTNEAFSKLIAATNAAADETGYDINKDMEQIRAYSERITNDPYETSHADNIRKAADNIAVVLQNIQQNANPELSAEASAVKDAAASINPAELTLDQKNEVKSFFDEASVLLEKINQ
ncbi:hypothetical protein KJK34_04785 [Flavobacterium sp. D11R37]|uniref:hypothetical protein n=1 Tax=Flavobacterium coralii TaxID=2838017 RepID=UPI001CA7466E|nr:hypothetical protein [Flavobacterium coralii]MBY8962063.1 hypothetical protein [Flavobacterium coralii]